MHPLPISKDVIQDRIRHHGTSSIGGRYENARIEAGRCPLYGRANSKASFSFGPPLPCSLCFFFAVEVKICASVEAFVRNRA